MRAVVAIFGLVLLIFFVHRHAASQERTRSPKAEESAVLDVAEARIPKISDARPMSFWMAKKLEFSKSILESLTSGDFDKLAKDAEQMRLLGKIEGFVRRKNDDYRTQLHTFDSASLELVRQAKRHSAEGAALAFNQLTTSCVACHVMLREGID